MALPRWRIWLHYIGYVSTAIVAVQLCFIGFLITKSARDQARHEAANIASSRTSIGPLHHSAQDKWVRPHLIRLLAGLPAISNLNSNGLRFAVAPSFGYAEYALSLSLKPGLAQAEGQLRVIIRDQKIRTKYAVRTLEIKASRREAEELFRRVDALTRSYRGSGTMGCLDGAPLAYERIVGERIWSGEGNCQPVYNELSGTILTFIRAHVESPLLPTQNDWHHKNGIKI